METPDLILLNISYAVHHADWNYQNVNSPFARIYFIQEGAAKVHLSNRVFSLKSGHLYLIPPFTLHSYECHAYFSLFYIHIYENPLSSYSFFEDCVFSSELPASSLDEKAVKELYEINPERDLKQYDPSDYDNAPTLLESISLHTKSTASIILETKGLLYLLCSRFLENTTSKNEFTDGRIKKIVRYIRTNIEGPLSIDALSEMCYLSKDHFIRLFKRELGLGRNTRIENMKKTFLKKR